MLGILLIVVVKVKSFICSFFYSLNHINFLSNFSLNSQSLHCALGLADRM